MPRPRCGNDPRAQLTDGDRQALADFRAFLTARAQEKTMATDQTRPPISTREAEIRRTYADWPVQTTVHFLLGLIDQERAARATDQANAFREAADFVGNDDTCDCGGCDSCVPNKLAAELRRRADEAQR